MSSVKACPSCGGAARAAFVAKDLNQRVTDADFSYYRCDRCRLIYLDPLPDDLGRYYPQSYYQLPEDVRQLARNASQERYKIDILLRHIQAGRLVEIGPATGAFCYLAKEAGFDVHAIEMDERCARFLTTFGIKVENSDEEAAALRRLPKANAIVLWHVLEHLQRPWEMLDAIADRLEPGGVAVLATPNPDAFQFRILGARWAHVDAPRHATLIPHTLLTERMTKRGMQLRELTSCDPGSIGWNEFGWAFSLSNLASSVLGKRVLRKGGRMIASLLRPIEQTGLRGSAYTAVYRKIG